MRDGDGEDAGRTLALVLGLSKVRASRTHQLSKVSKEPKDESLEQLM